VEQRGSFVYEKVKEKKQSVPEIILRESEVIRVDSGILAELALVMERVEWNI
jgi:hypothetical protein